MTSKIGSTFSWKAALQLAGTAAVYALLTKAALTFYSANGLVTTIWPAAGVSLAAILLGGKKFSVSVYVGAFAGQLWTGESPGAAALISLGSTFEPLLGAWLLARKSDFNISLQSARDYWRLCFLAGALSPAVCALIGVNTLLLSGRIATGDFWHELAHWWMGDALGIVVFAPLILVWRHPPRRPAWSVAEAIVLLGLSFLAGQIIFLDWFDEVFGLVNRGYWMYLVVSWAAVRLGLHGVLLIILIAILQALAGSAQGVGFFANDLARTQLTNFWAYMMILATVGTSVAIIFSERERITAQLRMREDRLRLAKSAAGLGVFDHDLASDTHEWDERARELWGYTADEPISFAKFMAGVHPDDRAATQAAVERALDPRGNGEYYAEYRVIKRSDGSLCHIAANGRVFFENGRALRFTGTVKDISVQKRLEKEMQGRRSEMELLVNQQVAAHTAAAIAHELNQPLVSISVYSEAALRMLRGGSKHPEKLAHALEGAMGQAQRAGRTLHELLGFLHKGEAAAEPVDLNAVVRDAIDSAAESGYGEFRPVVELAPDLPPVMANRIQIQKVLVNLLHNGVEAMRHAGVSTSAITIKVRTMTEKNLAQVTVQDSGPGLDAETVQRIFEPFFTTKPDGIGLGLAISRALVEAHGGQLWADLEADGGATFHFTLPLAA